MQFFIPVPKVWEWVEPFPFPFPNVKKSFPLTPGLDLTVVTLADEDTNSILTNNANR